MSINDVVNVLSVLGILPALQIAAVSGVAIYLYRYFTDKG